jgi:hypothetical protein
MFPTVPCTGVLPAAQYKAAEATAQLVLDADRTDRKKIAIVAVCLASYLAEPRTITCESSDLSSGIRRVVVGHRRLVGA